MDRPLIGEIRMVGFSAVPEGWAACNGQLLAIAEHPALYRVLGTRYGGDGRASFALPDLRGRVALQADGDRYPLGATGGEAIHSLTVEEMPAHQHRVTASNAPAVSRRKDGMSPAVGARVAYGPPADLAPLADLDRVDAPPAGHNNMQPFLGVQFIIALAGKQPSGS